MESKHDKCLRLFMWAHRKQSEAFHDVRNPNRVDLLMWRSAICRRLRPLCVKYGVLHRDCLSW